MMIYYIKPFIITSHRPTGMKVVYSKYSNKLAILSEKALGLFEQITDGNGICNIDEKDFTPYSMEFVHKTIDCLVKNMILFLSEEKMQEGDYASQKEDFSGIDTVYIHPTMRCNLHCSYCYNRDVIGVTSEMGINQWSQIIEQLYNNGLKNVIITGGEPSLYNELFQLVKRIKRYDVYLTLITNGTQIKLIIPMMDYLDQLIVSVDSDNSTINGNARLGAENYDVYNSVSSLITHKEKVSINAVVTKNNLAGMDSFQKQVETDGMKFRRMRFSASCIEEVEEMTYDIIYPEEQTYTFGQQRYKCHAGTNVIAITADGNVYPCQTMINEKFRITNTVYKDWLNRVYSFYNCDTFLGKSYEKIKKCKLCDVEYLCCGGCPSSRYKLTGSFFNIFDKECEYMHKCSIRYLENVRVRCLSSNKEN